MRPLASRIRWAVLRAAEALLLLGVALQEAGAQVGAPAHAPADSVAAWTLRLRTGNLEARADAVGSLAAQPTGSLPAETKAAIVEELVRINEALFPAAPGIATIEGADDLGAESFGEYYLDLVTTVAHIETSAARQALVRSVAVSDGVRRRVARQGDLVIPELARMIERGYEAGSALETLALSWYWADSTGSPLSPISRGTIVRALLHAPASEDYGVRRSAAEALELTGDPAFLSLAIDLAARSDSVGNRLVAAALRTGAIPTLAVREGRVGVRERVAGLARALDAACGEGAPSASPGAAIAACQAIGNRLETAERHLTERRPAPARNVLEAALAHAERASASGAFDSMEAALVVGGIMRLLEAL